LTSLILFFLSSLFLRTGKQALAGGQSHTSSGLFYGGVQWEETPKRVFEMLESEGISKSSPSLAAMFHVDIHTGVGPFKHDSLLAENAFLPELEEMLGSRGELKSDWHLDGIGDWVKYPPSLVNDYHNGESKDTDEEDVQIKVSGTKEAKDGVAYEAKGHIGGGLFYKSVPERVQAKGRFVSVTQEFGTIKGTKIFR
jgi:hypothetical protein